MKKEERFSVPPFRLFQNRSEEAGIYPTSSPMAAFTKVSL